MRGLTGKVAVVAGSAGALGMAIARRLLDEGVRIVGADLDDGALARTAAELGSDAFVPVSADLTTEQGAAHVVATAVARFGRIDLLANAVGIIGPTQPIASSSVDELDAVYRVNIRGVFLMMKAIIDQLLKQQDGGAIVNLASVAALRARPGRAFYGLSKRAVVALTSSAALEYGARNIRINCVAPGPIDSPMFRAMNAGAASNVWDSSGIPLGRLGQPQEVASIVAFLLSEDAAFCTGGLYLVDGGAALSARHAMTADVRLAQDTGGWQVRRDEALARAARAAGLWPDTTVAEFARRRYEQHPDKVQLIDNGRSFTCAEIYRRASSLAAYLAHAGIRPGDVISFQLPNWWEANVINIAAAMTGAIVNPIVPINRDNEVGFMLRDCAAKVVFIPHTFRSFDYAAMLRRLKQAPDLATEVVVVRSEVSGYGSLESILADYDGREHRVTVDADAVKLIMYTSGTTGRPKGVLHSHNSINADSIKMKKALGLSADDLTFIPSPLTHVTGYLYILNMPWCGDVPAVSIDVWNPEIALEQVGRYGCAFMAGATPFLRGMVDAAKACGQRLPKLRNYLCGGAAVPPALVYEAAEQFPNCIVWRNYGSTEAPTLTRGPESRADLRFGAETDGRIYEAQVRITDLVTGKPVPEGTDGEIRARESSMALGYTRIADNDAAYDADGFFRMGDVGKIVAGDHILLTDRIKDIIIRSGENLSPKEIEDVLVGSPLIADAAIVGVPDQQTGEAVFAFLVPRAETPITLAHIDATLRAAGLARQKTPKHFKVIDQLPRSPAGKVVKHELRSLARQLMAATSSEGKQDA